VDVGVVAQVARPGLQDAQHANLPAQEARILGELLERCGRRTKQQGIDRLRVRAGDGTQFGGQGEVTRKEGTGSSSDCCSASQAWEVCGPQGAWEDISLVADQDLALHTASLCYRLRLTEQEARAIEWNPA
jgi:hypothetical protein